MKGIAIGAVAVLNALFLLVVLRLAVKARKRPVVSGSEELVGASGEILEVTADAAWMRLHSERWRVRSDSPLYRGQRVRVTAREGLVLQVEPTGIAPIEEAAASGRLGASGS